MRTPAFRACTRTHVFQHTFAHEWRLAGGDARAREAHKRLMLMLGDRICEDREVMRRWWERTDEEPGLSWPGAIVAAAVVAVGLFIWFVVTDDGPLDGDVVGAIGGGIAGIVFFRFSPRDRIRRNAMRDAARRRSTRSRRWRHRP